MTFFLPLCCLTKGSRSVDNRLSVGGRSFGEHKEVPLPSTSGFKIVSAGPLDRPEPEEGKRGGSHGGRQYLLVGRRSSLLPSKEMYMNEVAAHEVMFTALLTAPGLILAAWAHRGGL